MSDAKVCLIANDGRVVVPRDVACQSMLVHEMLVDDDDDAVVPEIPLPNVTLATLRLALEYCEHHAVPGNAVPKIARPIKSNSMRENLGEEFAWDADYIDRVGATHEDLFMLVLAANYLNIDSLLDLGCAKIASMLKGKTPQKLREEFGIAEPTPEEEEQIRKDNDWIFTIRPLESSAPT